MGSPENRFLEEGKSAELCACLQIIQETTADDSLKYSDKTCRELARLIVCRNYAPAVLELCHLVVGAIYGGSHDQRYEALFFASGPARAGGFRAWFAAFTDQHKAIDIGRQEIFISYADKPFAVTYGRMPLLSALMEFLMTAIGYAPLDETLSPLLGGLPSHKQVSDAANDLSRQVYSYLGEHLPPVQEQRKSQSFLQFASDRAAAELAAATINDDTVLDYWMAHADGDSDDRGVDVKTYRSVFRMAAHLVRVLRYAEDQYRMNGALPIGTDFESGEIDPGDLETALAEIELPDQPLSALHNVVSAGVKITNKREMERLQEALHGEDVGRALPKSILRNAVFGDAQAGLVQALRRAGPLPMAQLIAALPDDDYQTRRKQYSQMIDHLQQMMLASFHVLARAGKPLAASLAIALHPDLDISDLAQDPNEPDWGDSNVVSFHAENAMARFFERLEADDNGELGKLSGTARTAFKSISRQGFSQAEMERADIVEQFGKAAIALIAVHKELSRFLNNHIASIDWDQLITVDTTLFRSQFTTLYGGQNG